MASNNNSYIDTSPDCAICFESLSNGETITLKCGHRWHITCIKEQLAHAQPSKTSRLLFSGCKCAKCNVVCEHPALENLTRRTDALREQVDELAIGQIKVDAPEEWARATDAASKTALLDSARRSYAFYLCGACEEPYFGGTVACADQEDGERTLPEDRLCGNCTPKSVAVCEKSTEHGGFHVWKCRYCCEPSTFVCYGNVHFCNKCHERNSARDARKKRGEDVSSLEAIPCPGESCTYPKKEGCIRHKNGNSFDCEQVYYCICCQTKSNALEEQPGSRNFVVNPSGANGLRGWNFQNMPWKVEQMGVQVDNSTTTNFVSTYQWCVMYQSVPIHTFVRDPTAVRVEASAKFMGRTDCPSVFRMEIIATDAQKRVLQRLRTDVLNSPVDFWEKATLILEPMVGLHEVTLCIAGKDSRFWHGNYGSKVCHCSVRILGTAEELESVLVQG
ncbi:hypothetical protein ACHAXN_012647 [Cyclotella atomus]